ncbi:MAG: NERD domain-containing protein [Gammaproteobacteria bacterium]|nr:NERD domain-containing protein [Gammaproteobacteria bacterium]
MTLSDFHTILLAGFIAIVLSLVFWSVTLLSGLTARKVKRKSPFPEQILYEAGHFQHRELVLSDERMNGCLGALLIFVVISSILYYALPREIPMAISLWLWIIAGILLVLGVAFLIKLAIDLARRRSALAYAYCAQIAIGHVLRRTALLGYRVFHHVPVEGGGFIDHVVVGPKGAYAIIVVARKPDKKAGPNNVVHFKNAQLWFNKTHKMAQPVRRAGRTSTMLVDKLTKLCGHRVVVQSVIVVPGWKTKPDPEANHLILNEQNILMLTNWTPVEAHLMNEDVTMIQEFLMDSCKNPQPV